MGNITHKSKNTHLLHSLLIQGREACPNSRWGETPPFHGRVTSHSEEEHIGCEILHLQKIKSTTGDVPFSYHASIFPLCWQIGFFFNVRKKRIEHLTLVLSYIEIKLRNCILLSGFIYTINLSLFIKTIEWIIEIYF